MTLRTMCAVLFVAACGHAPESSAPRAETVAVAPAPAPPPTASAVTSASAEPASSASSASPPAPALAPTLDAAACAKNAPPGSKCKWSVVAKSRCSGAAVVPNARPAPPTEWQCVCNGCETDGDCKAKASGKCQSFFRVCGPTASACVYPGDLCAANGGCEKKTFPRGGSATIRDPGQCTHDGNGHAVCGAMQQPPPASRPPPRGGFGF